MAFSRQRFDAFPVLGILRGFTLERTVEIVDAACSAGLGTLEVAMNSPDAAGQIRALSARFGDRMNIGAGTVLSTDSLDAALDAGASFIVTPVVQPEVIRACVSRQVPVFPGAFTPTEIFQAVAAGAEMVKLFPADLGGPEYVKSVLAPLDNVRLLATGGIRPDNIHAYRAAGAAGFGVGSPLFDREHMRRRDWPWLEQQIARFRSALACPFD